jgi:hypothetical protein
MVPSQNPQDIPRWGVFVCPPFDPLRPRDSWIFMLPRDCPMSWLTKTLK